MLNGKNSIYRRVVVFLLSVWLVVAWLPAHSQSQALGLARQAQQLYDAGQIAQAALTWQQAAIAFQERGNRLQSTKSLLNQSQALQDLGMYSKACNVLLQALAEENLLCEPQQLDELIETFTKGAKISKVETIGLRSLANVLLQQKMLPQSEKLLRLNYSVVKEPEQVASTLLALGNVRQAIADRVRDRWNYERITEIIDRQKPEIALEPYGEVFSAYENTANNRLAPTITRLQARLNYLSLLIEIEDWWQLQTARRIKSWQRLDSAYLIQYFLFKD